MPSTVAVNQRTVVHAGSDGVSIGVPDVCLTPASPAPPVPVPYPNVAQSTDSDGTAATVSADGQPLCIASSTFTQSTGDEAGTVGGVASGVNRGAASFVQHSFDVQVEGEGVARALDLMLHNGRNTPPAPLIQPPLPGVAESFAGDDETRDQVRLAHAAYAE